MLIVPAFQGRRIILLGMGLGKICDSGLTEIEVHGLADGEMEGNIYHLFAPILLLFFSFFLQLLCKSFQSFFSVAFFSVF